MSDTLDFARHVRGAHVSLQAARAHIAGVTAIALGTAEAELDAAHRAAARAVLGCGGSVEWSGRRDAVAALSARVKAMLSNLPRLKRMDIRNGLTSFLRTLAPLTAVAEQTLADAA